MLIRRAEFEASAANRPAPPSFREALLGDTVALIAEVKRRSPSAGSLAPGMEPAGRAAGYVAGGARAISVLTEPNFFGGSVADLAAVADAVAVPVLRKDFILDEAQIVEARAAGAAAVLLIVRALGGKRLTWLLAAARTWGMEALVEVHDGNELGTALDAGAQVIGVNSRDLASLMIDTDRAWRIVTSVPPDRVAVAESGMETRADVERAAEAGADAVLIGTALSRRADVGTAVGDLVGVRCHGR